MAKQDGRLVLIIDDNADDCEACIRVLSKAADIRYRFEAAADGPSGLRAIAVHDPDIVLLDYSLPGSDGLLVLGEIRQLYPNLPVIMLTGQGSETVAAKGIKAGASDYFSKAALAEQAVSLTDAVGDKITLHGAIESALGNFVPPAAVSAIYALVIDDNEDDRAAYVRALGRVPGAQYEFSEGIDGPSGLDAIAVRMPDVVLLDYSLPGTDGLAVLEQIREAYPFLPVIMLTGQGDEGLAVRGIKAGAVDYLVKSGVSGALLHRSIVGAIEHLRAARTISLQNQTILRQRKDLEAANYFLHGLLDHIPDPVFVKESAHRLVMANGAFRELVGAAQEASAAEAVHELWIQDDLAFESNVPVVGEQMVRGESGEAALFSVKRATFTDRVGRKVLVGVMRDITEQRRAEEEFKKQAAQLVAQSQDLASLGAILEDSLQEIFIVDAASLAIMQANKGAQRNLGFTQAELEGMSVRELTPQFNEAQLRKLLEPPAGGEQAESVYAAAYRRKDGSVYDVEVHAQRALYHGCQVFVQTVLDVTERKRVERMKNEFISQVSHELRTPLTSIRGALGLINGGVLGELPPKAAAMLSIAHSNAERLTRLVNDILALEKSVSGDLSIDIREMAVGEVLRQAVEAHSGFAAKYKVEFALEPVPADSLVMADPLRLMQVLANLMSNAAKFSAAGAVCLLRAAEVAGSVRFAVEDRGCGIPENFRARVFEKFAQADASLARRYEGSGLGLAITKQLLEAMGGHIWFESEVGRGTTFFFELPKAVKARVESVRPDEALRVLVCEDDPDTALIIKLAVEQAGFEAITASNIEEARRKLGELAFSVMTLDLRLPDGDGLEFLQELRMQAATSGLPVVVVSAWAGEAHRKSGRNGAAVHWVGKPLEQQTLIESVRSAFARAEGTV